MGVEINIYSPDGDEGGPAYYDDYYDDYDQYDNFVFNADAFDEQFEEDAEEKDNRGKVNNSFRPGQKINLDDLHKIFDGDKKKQRNAPERIPKHILAIKKKMDLCNRYALMVTDFDSQSKMKRAKGSFTYRCNGKKQNYICNVKSIDDVIYICALLQKRDLITHLPQQYKKVYDLFENANFSSLTRFTCEIYDEYLKKWLNVETKGRKKVDKKIKNPKTNRWIKNDPNNRNYKKIFGKIKLKKVIYEPLQNYNSIDYDVDEYCVPSYLKSFLLKKEFKAIENDLELNQTPTYIELTIILNKIDYNLTVYITESECIQKQDEYKKKLTIMIHNEHMYVLKNTSPERKNIKTEECDQEFYDRISSEVYTNSYKINNGTKYKLKNKFKDINKHFQMKSTFSHININFYNNSDIRPIRYINNKFNVCSGLDINQCYYNILKNTDYVFPIQNGTEIFEVYDYKIDTVLDGGFYYLSFDDDDDDEYIFFGNWVLGYIINKLKLKQKIKYKMCTSHAVNGLEEDKFEYIDIIHYTGNLAKYETEKNNIFECEGDEALAYQQKYEDAFYTDGTVTVKYIKQNGKEGNQDIHYLDNSEKDNILKEQEDNILFVTKPCVTLSRRYLLKNSGIYAYMAIMQYARLQLYTIYKEIKKLNKDVNISKIFTDAIYFDRDINFDLTKLNKTFLKSGFSVKSEESKFKWKSRDIICTKEPKINNNVINHYENIYELLEKNESFCIDAKAGYGKSHMVRNDIIPYLQNHNMKYILSATTKELSESLGCDVVHNILLSKDSYLDKLEDRFSDIDYFIIDECSMISVNIINVIEYLKSKCSKLKIILLGDINQCSYEQLIDNLMRTPLFNSIIDFNILSIKWHKNARYDMEYDIFLDGLLDFKSGKDINCIKYIKKYFSKQTKNKNEKSNDDIILTYTNEKGKTFGRNDNEKYIYSTVHRAQGKTFDKKYSVYEIEKMDIRIIYTALSRCTNPELITIYI